MKRITFYLVAFFLAAFSWQGMAQSTTIHITTSGGSYSSEKWVSITDAVDGGGNVIWDQGGGTYGASSGLIDLDITIPVGTYYVNCYDKYDDGWDGTLITVTDADGNVIGDNGGVSPDNGVDDDSSSSWDTAAEELEASFEIIVPVPPTCPAPSDLMVSLTSSTGVDLSWTDNASASAWEYVVQEAGTGEPTTAGNSAAAVTVSVSGLTGETAYEVYVRADCTGGDFSSWAGPVEFFTGYCQPEITDSDLTYIDAFTTSYGGVNIENTATGFSTDNYGNYFDTMAVSAGPEQSFEFSAEIVGGTVGCAIWVDWNNDFIFDVATENVFQNGGYGSGPFVGTITVPAGTADGDYRMRIMIDYLDGTIDDDACTFNGNRGEVEDYKLTVDSSIPANNSFIGAIPIVPSPEGTACDADAATFTAHLAGDGTTDSGMDGSCSGVYTGLDRFYSWTATTEGLIWNDGNSGNPGIVIRDTDGNEITCEGTWADDDILLAGWAIGDDLIIQIYDYSTSDVDVTFCLAEATTFAPVITTTEVADCANLQFTVDVDVVALGGAASATISDDQGSATQNVTATGVVSFGPYPDGTTVNFTIVNDADAALTSTEVFTYFCPPANDLAVDAIAVACGDSVDGDTSQGATVDLQGDCGSVDNDAPNVWYTFTGTGTAQSVTASLCGSSYDTSIAIFTGTPGALVCYANNDDACSLQSEVTFVSDGVQTYYIEVEGYSSGSTGAFTLAISCEDACTPAVTNQDCASALPIVVDDAAISSDNTCATVNIENPSCDQFGTIADVWFSFVAPAAGITQITTTLGTATDINLAVYEGACGSLVEVAGSCSDADNEADTINFVEGDLIAGNTYYVQAWNSGSAGNVEEGTFDIEITNLVISVPDCPTLVFPADGATDVLSPVTLDWDAATTGDAADSYNLYVSINGGAEFLFDSYTDTQSVSLGLQPDLTVAWRVVPVNAAGENTACATTFTFSSVVGTDDYDGDGVDNLTEYDPDGDPNTNDSTDMTNPCDPAQAAGYTGYDATNAIWMAADCDGDGMTNGDEDAYGSDPYDANSNGIDGLETVGFEYYPNPVNSNLTVKANENITSIAIFNMLGQQVKQVNPSSLNAQIDMTNLANGTYFIKATVGERVGTFKIVKK